MKLLQKIKKNGNWLKVVHSSKKEKKKKKDTGKDKRLFKVIPKEERGTDTSGWEGLNQYSAPPSHSSSNSFWETVVTNMLAK